MNEKLRSIVVTGASRGLGKAIAQSLASPDAFVWVNYRSKAHEAEAVVTTIKSMGGHAKSLPFDVGNSEQVKQAFEQIESEQGGVDVLVNNSGIAIDSLLLRAKDEDIAAVIQTNLVGSIYCARQALKTMMKRKNHGRIITVGSVVGQMGNTGQTVYAATKAGIEGFTKSLAREVASRQITVNAVAPGFIQTEMTEQLSEEQKNAMLQMIPLKRYGHADEVASVVQFLASFESSYITGQTISINGGMWM